MNSNHVRITVNMPLKLSTLQNSPSSKQDFCSNWHYFAHKSSVAQQCSVEHLE